MKTPSLTRRVLSVAGILALMLVTLSIGRGAAAQDSSSMDVTADCATSLGIGVEGDACVSIVHASADAPLVDIYVDGDLALSGLGFGWWSNWVALPAGEHLVQVTPTGEATEAAVIDATVDLEAGAAYQVAATGFVSEIAPQIYGADVSAVESDTSRVRVVHTVADAPAVDIAVTGGDVLVAGLEFPNASDYIEVPAGAYDLEVRVAGTEDVVLPLPGVEFAGSTVYDVYAIGTVENNAIAPFVIPSPVMAVDTTSGEVMAASSACGAVLGIGGDSDACVNIVHASPDAPAVYVYVNGDVALNGLEYGGYSGWVALPAGEYQIQVAPAGTSADMAVIDAMVSVEAGQAYQVAATGLLANIAPAIFPVDLSAPENESARVRVIHTSPDAPAVDIAVTGGDVVISNLEFPNASEALDVPAGTYDLEVRPAGTTDVALALPGVVLEAGMVYDVFAIGQLADGSLDVLVVPSMAAHGA